MAISPVHNEKEILSRIAAGDQRAFTVLFDAYYQGLGSYVYKVTESKELTEEIVQDAFMKVWEKREMLGEIDNFSSFLFILSRNRMLNYLRQLAKLRAQQLSWSKEHENDSYVMDSASPNDEYDLIIQNAVSELPPQQQKVYLLSRHERLKYEEIAFQMGLSKETVKKHMHLALSFLKQHVKKQIDEAILLLLITPMLMF